MKFDRRPAAAKAVATLSIIGLCLSLASAPGCGEGGGVSDTDPRPVEKRSKYLETHPEAAPKTLKKGKSSAARK